MSREWLWTPTPAFLAAWRGMPSKEERQILEKLNILEQDSSPDGNVKMSIAVLLALPAARGLFHRAILFAGLPEKRRF